MKEQTTSEAAVNDNGSTEQNNKQILAQRSLLITAIFKMGLMMAFGGVIFLGIPSAAYTAPLIFAYMVVDCNYVAFLHVQEGLKQARGE